MGISNTCAALPGIFGNLITGAIMESTGSWTMVFAVVSSVYFAGATTYLLFGSADPLEDNAEFQSLPDEDSQAELASRSSLG